MHSAPLDERRNILPRWRTFQRTLAAGELDFSASQSERSRSEVPDSSLDQFRRKRIEWERSRTASTAAEFVSAAVVLGYEQKAHDAAEFLLESDAGSLPGVRLLAESVLHGFNEDLEVEPLPEGHFGYRNVVRNLRSSLRDDPRNVVKRVDLARAYAVLGQEQQAVSAMEMALKLASGNRFVLRSAARLFVHVEQPDRAHDLLRRAHSVGFDPWLLASEIAVANVAGRQSSLRQKGYGLLTSDRWSAFQLSELASALATEGLRGGNYSSARRLFGEALTRPNENSLAQAEWASRQIDSFEIDPKEFEVPWSFEAESHAEYFKHEFEEALFRCRDWFFDEPYSSRPAQFGSFVSGVALERFEDSADWARRGLESNPEDQSLRNNLVFALASAGEIDEAAREMKLVDKSKAPEPTQIALLATEGLLAYRQRDPERGRRLYRQAVERAKPEEAGKISEALPVQALLYFLKEELHTGGDSIARLVAEVRERVRELEHPERAPYLRPLLERATEDLKRTEQLDPSGSF